MNEDRPLRMNELYISSSDTLCGLRTDQRIETGWNDRPPLFVDKDNDQLLKGMIRHGIPPALRCPVWISSIIKTCHAHMEFDYAEEYRTLGKARALDHAWNVVLKQTFSDESELDDLLFQQEEPVDFGHLPNHLTFHPNVSSKGTKALALVLTVTQEVVGLDPPFAPLVPPLCALLLRAMSESYAFYCLREMALNSSWYFPVSQVEHVAWCRAFQDILGRLHPSTHKCMKENGSLDDLDPIFRGFFLPILQYQHVLRIMDIYTYEGGKVIFRFAVALVCLFKKDIKDETFLDSASWWDGMKRYTHSRSFKFDVLVKKAYGYHGTIRKRVRFPRRHIVARIIRMEEEKVMMEMVKEEETSHHHYDNNGENVQDKRRRPYRPIGLVENKLAILAKPAERRVHLAWWLPPTLRLTKLDLIFSTNRDGRSLDMFYRHVKNCKHTILLCEVLDNNAIIGMFASQAWRISSHVYGDGECFLFRFLDTTTTTNNNNNNKDVPTNANKAWKWSPKTPTKLEEEEEVVSGSFHSGTEEDGFGTTHNNNTTTTSPSKQSLLETFMIGRPHFISMGGNADGTCGLRLNEDLTKGESAPATGFNNDPLPGLSGVFDIGIVEVYRLVRAVDGKTLEEVAAEAFTKMGA